MRRRPTCLRALVIGDGEAVGVALVIYSRLQIVLWVVTSVGHRLAATPGVIDTNAAAVRRTRTIAL